MTTLDLEPIKERLAAATPGPWRVWHDPDPTKVRATAVETAWYHGDIKGDTELITDYLPTDADAEMIANAPEDIAALVAEVERLRATIHVLTSERDSALERNNDLIEQSEKQQSRLSAVENLHRRSTYKSDEPYCETCYQAPYGYAPYPCPTIRALEAA